LNNAKLPKKVCLIVDNPARDLDGMVLLARRLAISGCDVFLVPMYSAGYEVASIAPDFVLLNYARSANMQMIKTFSAAGMAVGILDTEGGVWESVEKFVKSVPLDTLNDDIDQYYTWGPIQREAFLQYTQLAENKISVTGPPRYDFCKSPWVNALESYNISSQNFVLIISNFALAYPRFGSPETEMNNMVAVGFDREYAQARYEDEKVTSVSMLNLIVETAKKFPQIEFVVRTHPFENDARYKNEFKNYNNVKIVREGPVMAWLKDCQLMLHFNSSVSIDAVLMGVPVYTPNWLSTDVSKGLSDITLNISTKLNNEEDWFKVLSRVPIGPNQELERGKKALSDWFYSIDGLAHVRVSEKITEFLVHNKKKVDLVKCKEIFFYGSTNKKNWKGYVDSLGRHFLGSKNYRWIRNHVLTKNFMRGTKSDKFFNVNQVNSILMKLNVIEKLNVTAFEVQSYKSLFPRATGDSVFVSAKTESELKK
jgi:surface carbohydrate biosynthesis protein